MGSVRLRPSSTSFPPPRLRGLLETRDDAADTPVATTLASCNGRLLHAHRDDPYLSGERAANPSRTVRDGRPAADGDELVAWPPDSARVLAGCSAAARQVRGGGRDDGRGTRSRQGPKSGAVIGRRPPGRDRLQRRAPPCVPSGSPNVSHRRLASALRTRHRRGREARRADEARRESAAAAAMKKVGAHACTSERVRPRRHLGEMLDARGGVRAPAARGRARPRRRPRAIARSVYAGVLRNPRDYVRPVSAPAQERDAGCREAVERRGRPAVRP
jgi:hypothetical protein